MSSDFHKRLLISNPIQSATQTLQLLNNNETFFNPACKRHMQTKAKLKRYVQLQLLYNNQTFLNSTGKSRIQSKTKVETVNPISAIE
jgi:hypothetical protein